MSAANLQPDTALPYEPQANGEAPEPSRPTQPWSLPPLARDASALEGEDFDFHDTIPAPPWLDEPVEAMDLPAFPAR